MIFSHGPNILYVLPSDGHLNNNNQHKHFIHITQSPLQSEQVTDSIPGSDRLKPSFFTHSASHVSVPSYRLVLSKIMNNSFVFAVLFPLNHILVTTLVRVNQQLSCDNRAAAVNCKNIHNGIMIIFGNYEQIANIGFPFQRRMPLS